MTTSGVIRELRDVVNALAIDTTSNVVSTTFRKAAISLVQRPSAGEGLMPLELDEGVRTPLT
jgi:hypothetical protein